MFVTHSTPPPPSPLPMPLIQMTQHHEVRFPTKLSPCCGACNELALPRTLDGLSMKTSKQSIITTTFFPKEE